MAGQTGRAPAAGRAGGRGRGRGQGLGREARLALPAVPAQPRLEEWQPSPEQLLSKHLGCCDRAVHHPASDWGFASLTEAEAGGAIPIS